MLSASTKTQFNFPNPSLGDTVYQPLLFYIKRLTPRKYGYFNKPAVIISNTYPIQITVGSINKGEIFRGYSMGTAQIHLGQKIEFS